MRAYLVRVGIDQAFGKWNAPIDPATGDFVYIPIPEKAGTAFQPGMATDYAPFRSALDVFAAVHPNAEPGICTPPEALDDLNPHLDPDFERLTYGDNGLRRGKGLCDLGAGDLVVFFAGMRPVQQCQQPTAGPLPWRLELRRGAHSAPTRMIRLFADEPLAVESRPRPGRRRARGCGSTSTCRTTSRWTRRSRSPRDDPPPRLGVRDARARRAHPDREHPREPGARPAPPARQAEGRGGREDEGGGARLRPAHGAAGEARGSWASRC